MKYYSYIKYSKISKINSIQIKLASPQSILQWGLRKLFTGEIVGEIKSPQTMNYKTLKPENTGLFCEKIFGPIKDFECACGKFYENEFIGFCSQCGIEFVSSQVRRQRLGYIKLISPVVHIWYIKYISLLLNIPLKSIESIIYSTDTTIINNNYFDSKNNYIKKNESIKIFSFFKDFYNIDCTNIINNFYKNKNFITFINYNLYLQKDLFKYLNYIKKSLFLIKISSQSHINKTFRLSYYTITNCYGISYFSLWETKKQWNNIAFYMNCNSMVKEISSKIINLYSDNLTLLLKEYNDKFLFGVKLIYNWLQFFDYNFQLINLEKQIRFYSFEIKEEIKELSIIISTYFFDNNYYQKNNLLNLKKKIENLKIKKNKVFRRLRLIIYFRQSKIQPKWMIIFILPVLPPELRPIIELGSNKIAVSDINKLYQTILLRNIRLKKFYDTSYVNHFNDEVRYIKRLLQESVDTLIQNDKKNSSGNQITKSLSDILKGKRGRFRQNLLGKRVDYSARSVIIVDPTLLLYQCGLPKKIIIELFQPFIIRYLILNKYVKTISKAKSLIYMNNYKLLNIINDILKNHLVLLNRAPTLHKLGIQAFQPKLINGKAIKLHPLVCPAFNADFDGDQMGVHIPLSFEARAETWKLLWSRNNLLFSSTGMPLLTPGQDVVLGCYYLTSKLQIVDKNHYFLKSNKFYIEKQMTKNFYFTTIADVLKAYEQEKINIHTEIWIKCANLVKENKISLFINPLNINIYHNNTFSINYIEKKVFYNFSGYRIGQFIKTTVGRVIFNNILQKTFF